MLNLSDLKQTRVDQEILEEFKLETIPRMAKFGLSDDAIAQVLDLPLEVVQQTAQSQGIKPMSSDERNVAAFTAFSMLVRCIESNTFAFTEANLVLLLYLTKLRNAVSNC